MWIHRVPWRQPFFCSPDDRCNLTSWRPPRRRPRYCKVPLTYCRARNFSYFSFLLLPSHVLFTGSSSETWSNGGLSLPKYQRRQGVGALIAQETVPRDFCPCVQLLVRVLACCRRTLLLLFFFGAPDKCLPPGRTKQLLWLPAYCPFWDPEGRPRKGAGHHPAQPTFACLNLGW